MSGTRNAHRRVAHRRASPRRVALRRVALRAGRASSLSLLLIAGAAGCSGQLPEGATTFDVPTIGSHAGDLTMEALITGTLAIDEQGCTTLTFQEGEPPEGVLFPDAVGVEAADGTRSIVHEETGEVYATEGEEVEYGGGYVDDPSLWPETCGPASGEIAVVTGSPAGPPL